MYVITGATGQTGNVVAKTLLSKGEKVRVIGRTPERLKALAAEGAEPFAADLTDAAGVAKAFVDAKAVYVMMPPNLTSPDFRSFQDRVTDAIGAALRSAGVTHAVTLSSIGADKPDKTGPVVRLHYLERNRPAPRPHRLRGGGDRSLQAPPLDMGVPSRAGVRAGQGIHHRHFRQGTRFVHVQFAGGAERCRETK